MQTTPAEVTVLVSDLTRRRFTLPEAATILKVDVGHLRKTVDRGWLRKSYVQDHGRSQRALDGIDLVYVLIGDTMSPKVRKILYIQMKDLPESRSLAGTMELQVEAPSGSRTVDVPLDRAVHDVMVGISALDQTVQAVDGDGRIHGTQVEAHRIAALIEGGMSSEDVLRDYPNLVDAQVASAVAYAKAHPKSGRPYPTLTVKAALRRGRGGLGLAFAAARDEAEP